MEDIRDGQNRGKEFFFNYRRMYRQEKESQKNHRQKRRGQIWKDQAEGDGSGSDHQRSLGLGVGQGVGGWRAMFLCGAGPEEAEPRGRGCRGGTSCRRLYQPDPPLSPEEASVGCGWYPSEPQALHPEVRPSFLRSRTSPWAGSSGAAGAGGSPEWFGVGGLGQRCGVAPSDRGRSWGAFTPAVLS